MICSETPIRNINLQVEVSTPEDLRRLTKLCDELRQSLGNAEEVKE